MQKMSDPFISVIVTAYNRKEFLASAIKSALDQTLKRDRYEVIVSKNFQDPDIDALMQESGAIGILLEGASIGNRMAHVLRIAKGEIVVFLDDDDLWEGGKLAHIEALFKSDPDLVFYHNSQSFIDARGAEVEQLRGWDPVSNLLKFGEIGLTPGDLEFCDFMNLLYLYPAFNASSIAVRLSVLEPYLEMLEKLNAAPDDFLLFSALVSGRKLSLESKKLTKYRTHSKNVSISGIERASSVGDLPYRIMQEQAYSVMGDGFRGRMNNSMAECFKYYHNYLRLVIMLLSEKRQRREMLPICRTHLSFTLGYMLCRSRNLLSSKGKLGLRYNMTLSFISLIFLFWPKLAREAYRSLYMAEAKNEDRSDN